MSSSKPFLSLFLLIFLHRVSLNIFLIYWIALLLFDVLGHMRILPAIIACKFCLVFILFSLTILRVRLQVVSDLPWAKSSLSMSSWKYYFCTVFAFFALFIFASVLTLVSLSLDVSICVLIIILLLCGFPEFCAAEVSWCLFYLFRSFSCVLACFVLFCWVEYIKGNETERKRSFERFIKLLSPASTTVSMFAWVSGLSGSSRCFSLWCPGSWGLPELILPPADAFCNVSCCCTVLLVLVLWKEHPMPWG